MKGLNNTIKHHHIDPQVPPHLNHPLHPSQLPCAQVLRQRVEDCLRMAAPAVKFQAIPNMGPLTLTLKYLRLIYVVAYTGHEQERDSKLAHQPQQFLSFFPAARRFCGIGPNPINKASPNSTNGCIQSWFLADSNRLHVNLFVVNTLSLTWV